MHDDLPNAANTSPLLTTRTLGRHLEFHACIDSTNRRAKAIALSPDTPEGTVVVADQQTAGRGRMTRQWRSPAGLNLYLSAILRPSAPPQTIPQIALLAAIALHQALHDLLPELTFGLKWPNDLWSHTGRKLSGILCEATFAGADCAVIAGIGVNVNDSIANFPPDLQQTAATLADLAGHTLPRPQLLAALLNRLEPLLDDWQPHASLEHLLPYWNQHDILRGRPITVQDGDDILSGTAGGILPDGRLILDTHSGQRLIHAGDTHILASC